MKQDSSKILRLILVSVVTVLFLAFDISAATFIVTNTNDTGAGSLRQAILSAEAAGDDIINFDASFNVPRTITLASLITVTGSGGLTVNGPGASLLTVSGNNAISIFHISGHGAPLIGAIVFNNLTIADGRILSSQQTAGTGIGINSPMQGPNPTGVHFTANNVVFRNNRGGAAGQEGGAINCGYSGTVVVNNSTFTENRGSTISIGSGVGSCNLTINGSSFFGNVDKVIGCCSNTNTATVSINNSVFYNNGNLVGGANIDIASGGGITITNTTIANNRSFRSAVWIRNGSNNNTLTNVTIAGNFANSILVAGLDIGASVTVNVGNSIIANNFNALGANDVEIGGAGTLTSQGYNLLENVSGTISGNTTGNLIGVDPWLDGTMRLNGGTTKTLALRQNSPAIDTGDPNTFPATDQRGITRPQDGDGNGNSRSDIGAFERRLIDIPPTDKTDFDGDGKSDLSIFRPSVGQWWYLRSSDFGNRGFQFGNSTDKLVPADFTGDGKADIALWRPSSGEWFVLRSEDSSFYAVPFGTNGDIPAPGDFDGDGKADTAVYRPSDTFWYIQNSSGGTTFQQFGLAEDRPVVADYDGDGKDDISIFRPSVSEWWQFRSSAGVFGYQFGSTGDKTVQGDYTGDGKADVAIYRPSNGFWYVLRSEDSSFYSVPFGISTDIPTAGDYDGDGRFDTAVFRPSDNFWYVQGTTSGFFQIRFGTTGDIPLPSLYSAP